MKYTYLSVCLIIMFIAAACGNRNRSIVAQAERVVGERPDSAFVLLKSVNYGKLTDEADRAAYALTHARADYYLGRSLVTDSLLPHAISFYGNIADTAAAIDASIYHAHHLRALERKAEAFAHLDSLSAVATPETRRRINQELLGFAYADKDFDTALSIISRQIALAPDADSRFNFELKKITPLLSLGRVQEAVALCDSLFALPEAPETGSPEWLYLRINYAATLGERKETAAAAVAIIQDVIDRLGHAPAKKLVEFYIPMVTLQLNAGNISEALRYLRKVDEANLDLESQDPVAASYLEFMRIILDYERSGAVSLSRLSNVAHSLRKVSDDLELKRRERDDALESAYDLSRNNYELIIKHQRMWLGIIAIILAATIAIGFFAYISHRRRSRILEAEERIEALETMLKAANNPTTDKKESLLKRLLLQQLGIIRTFAEAPTAQNQEALRKISNIGNSDTPIDSLVKWDDLYPVIDELYNGFHSNTLSRYPGLFSEREIQILCLIRAGFSTKEIGVLLQQTSNSIYVSKTSIRKKLGVAPKEDFMAFLTTPGEVPCEA